MRRSTLPIKFSSIAAAILFALQLQACAPVLIGDQSGKLVTSEEPRTFVFHCDEDFHFVARTDAGSAWLFLPTMTVKALRVSEQRYRSDETLFRLKGQQAELETQDGKLFRCSNDRREAIWEHAKLNGADFRAVGNEPGWFLEIYNRSRLLLVTDYGSARSELELSQPTTDATSRTSRYEAMQDGQKVVLTLSAQACRDSMTGEEFESTVEVTLNGRRLHGCGRPLH